MPTTPITAMRSVLTPRRGTPSRTHTLRRCVNVLAGHGPGGGDGQRQDQGAGRPQDQGQAVRAAGAQLFDKLMKGVHGSGHARHGPVRPRRAPVTCTPVQRSAARRPGRTRSGAAPWFTKTRSRHTHPPNNTHIWAGCRRTSMRKVQPCRWPAPIHRPSSPTPLERGRRQRSRRTFLRGIPRVAISHSARAPGHRPAHRRGPARLPPPRPSTPLLTGTRPRRRRDTRHRPPPNKPASAYVRGCPVRRNTRRTWVQQGPSLATLPESHRVEKQARALPRREEP